jgi:hypothetical protein
MDTKLNTAIDEINQFVSERISLLLNDLIEESNEYAETKKQILQIPFVKKIINNIIYNTIHNEDDDGTTQENMTNENENIFLNIDENEDGSEELDNIVELDAEEDEEEEEEEEDDVVEEDVIVEKDDVIDQEEHCVCCGGNRDMVNEKCLTCLEDCCEDRQFDDQIEEELNNVVVTEVVVDDAEEEESESEEEDVVEESEAVVEATNEAVVVIEESEAADSEPEEEVEDTNNAGDDEEEVFEIEINGVNYFTTNEKSGIIYASDENSDPGDEVGVFQNGTPIFHT